MAGENKNDTVTKTKATTSPWVWGALASFTIITYVAMPNPLQPLHGEHPSIQHVFYYGWITAVFTGLGAIPLAFSPNLANYWVGLSNGTFQAHHCEKVAWFGRLLCLDFSRCFSRIGQVSCEDTTQMTKSEMFSPCSFIDTIFCSTTNTFFVSRLIICYCSRCSWYDDRGKLFPFV